MASQPQRFLDHLAAHGWTVLRTTPTSTPAAAPLASTAPTAPDRKREYGRTCCSTVPVCVSRYAPTLRPISTAPLAQGLRTAATSAPTGADVALVAALAALIPVAGDWGRHTPRPGWKERFDEY
ncbi:MAG: hypothetical protein E2591_24270 [Achromobacter sp.]|nr:hypothetical protein [Achromobacter sp.]